MKNNAMAEGLLNGSVRDVSKLERDDYGRYKLPPGFFLPELDYCDAEKEEWVWSIGRRKENGELLASTAVEFLHSTDYECVWLR